MEQRPLKNSSTDKSLVVKQVHVKSLLKKVRNSIIMLIIIAQVSFFLGCFFIKNNDIIVGWLFSIPLLMSVAFILKRKDEYQILLRLAKTFKS
jgi:hypothetical protein